MRKEQATISRRSFLSGSLAAAALAATTCSNRVMGANERIRLGVSAAATVPVPDAQRERNRWNSVGGALRYLGPEDERDGRDNRTGLKK